MNGITEIRMRKIQSRTRKYRRRYEWREITCLTVCSLFLLAGIGILLGGSSAIIRFYAFLHI